MKQLMIGLCLIALAGCGVDGEPLQPEATTQVTLSNAGVHLGGAIGVRQGPFSVRLGF